MRVREISRLRWIGCSLILLALAACSGSEGSPSAADSLADLGVDDGAHRGEVNSVVVTATKEAQIALSTGAELKIPAFAVDKDLTVELKRPADAEALGLIKTLPKTQKIASAPYVVTPHRTMFKRDVTVTLPVADGRDSKKLKVVWLEDEKDTSWKKLATPETEGEKASFKVAHFSVLLLVETDEEDVGNVDAGMAPEDGGTTSEDASAPLGDGGTGTDVDARAPTAVEAQVRVASEAPLVDQPVILVINGEEWAITSALERRTLPRAEDGLYTIAVTASPIGSQCTLAGGGSSFTEAQLQELTVTCHTTSHGLVGTLAGGTGTVSLTLQGAASGTHAIAENGPFTLPVSVPHGGALSLHADSGAAGVSCQVSPAELSSVVAEVSVFVSCVAHSGALALVRDAITGEPIAGAAANVLGLTMPSPLSAQDGTVYLDVPETVTGLVAHITSAGYAPQFVPLPDSSAERLQRGTWPLNPVTATYSFEAEAGLFAPELDVPAGLLASGPAVARYTVIDPSQDLSVVPGGFSFIPPEESVPAPTEVFSVVDVRLETSSGADLALSEGSLRVHMPIAARVPEPPNVAFLYRYDEALGHWTVTGEAGVSWDEITGEPMYEVHVSQPGAWAVALPLDTSVYTSCIVDSNGQPLEGALIEAHGLYPLSLTSTRSDASGNFSILVPSYGQANLSAVAPKRSRTRLLNGESESLDCLEALEDNLRVTLNWGAEPRDLDLYLYASDFGVWYEEPSVEVGGTVATLDVDETNGFGPEIISSGRLPEGRYRLVVHQYAGEFSIGESPTRLRVQTPDVDVLIRPSAQGDGTTDAWVATDLVVDAEGRVSVVPVDIFAMLDTVHLACPDPSASEPTACLSFQCGSGEQISHALYCDGTADCQDGSDEQGPSCSPSCGGDAGACPASL